MNYQKWEVDMIGYFDEMYEEYPGRASMFINSNDVLQFFVKISSWPPASFTEKKKHVTCFANSLERWGFEDIAGTDEERKAHLRSFLKGNLIIFKPEKKDEHLNAKDVRLIRSMDNFQLDDAFYPVPIFSERKLNLGLQQFVQNISDRKVIGKVNGLSVEKDDCPSFLVWEASDGDLFAIGLFSQFSHSYGGFTFIAEDGVKVTGFKESWMERSYYHEKHIPNLLFVARQVGLEVEEELSAMPSSTQVFEEEVTQKAREEIASTINLMDESVSESV